MAATQTSAGSASVQGQLWGARARDYVSLQESQFRPLYEDAVRRLGVTSGSRVLDVGCGGGGFCLVAAGAGAAVTGVDAAQEHVDIARERLPKGDFRTGDMQTLPYRSGLFDAITGFNSIQYAADPVAALEEMRRVARPGAAVLVLVWGREDRTELVAALRALGPLLPPAPPGAPGPFALSHDGALEQLVERGGLTPTDGGYAQLAFEYVDDEAMLRGNRSNGPVVLAERTSGEVAVVDALRSAFAPYRTSTGGYRLETEWRWVTARA